MPLEKGYTYWCGHDLKTKDMYMPSISSRELQILRLVAQEKTSKEIADDLFISSHTALSHRKNLMAKMQVKNTAGMVRKGFELGLLTIA